MKIEKLYKINFLAFIFLTLFYNLSKIILKLNDLAFRSFINYSFKIIIILLLLSLLIQLIILIYEYMKKNQLSFVNKLSSVLSISIISFFIFILLFYYSINSIFSHSPEYVVEKNNTKMVAYVDSFLEVNVHYYEYINPLLRGYSKIFTEDYGDGGYDPFEMNPIPPVENTTYYK